MFKPSSFSIETYENLPSSRDCLFLNGLVKVFLSKAEFLNNYEKETIEKTAKSAYHLLWIRIACHVPLGYLIVSTQKKIYEIELLNL